MEPSMLFILATQLLVWWVGGGSEIDVGVVGGS